MFNKETISIFTFFAVMKNFEFSRGRKIQAEISFSKKCGTRNVAF